MLIRLIVEKGPALGVSYTTTQPDRIIIGRAEDAQLCLQQDGRLSRRHLMIEVQPPLLQMQDLSSRNGTYLNDGGAPVPWAALRSGDRIRAGNSTIRVEVEQPLDPTLELTEGDLLLPDGRPLCRTCTEATQPLGQPGVAFYCDECQERILRHPPLPPGYAQPRELGRGSMGAVYVVQHLRMATSHAMKIILPRMAVSWVNQQRFLREARGQARLSHPNVVRVFDLYELLPGVCGLTMEYVPGENAAQLLERSGPLAPDLVVELGCQALAALAHAHDLNLVHRDVKDENLLLRGERDGRLLVKLADFGLARDYQLSGASGLTRPGQVAGTIPYMAPEQVLDFRGAQPSADLYALAATLYRLLTGAFPREYPAHLHWMLVNLEHPVVPLRQRRPELPQALAQVLARALLSDPTARYPDASALQRALRASLPR